MRPSLAASGINEPQCRPAKRASVERGTSTWNKATRTVLPAYRASAA
ncbi:MAG: hypothetical protein AW07_02511 [Candidatus Accumulibacter sp. SK-11]|nr:MAG: hypothetical protein AW07_02511 [Candidatus Accumulibacter sp. SK-11]